MDSNVFSQIMSRIPSRNRAYSLSQALDMDEDCLSLVLDARIHASIPAGVFDLKNLLVLSLQGIPIDELPSDISKLSQLKVLNLLACGVDQFPESIIDLPLEVLWLSDGVWDFIPDFIFEFKQLKSLVIDNYGLEKIPELITQCIVLEEISFCNNSIRILPDGFYSLVHLKTIFCSYNKIKGLDTRLGKFSNIRKVNFNHNIIPNIPESIGQLTRMNYLDFSFNKIEVIPTSIARCHLLSNLFLNNNSITDIPKKLFSLPISQLNISRNKIKEINSFISDCKRLRFLDISNNELNEIPEEINQLKQLEEINFNKNNLNDFPLGILGLDKIKKIKGWNKLLDADLRKHVIPFIKSADKNKIYFEERKELFSLFIKNDKLNKKESIALLNSGFRPFKIKAVEQLKKEVVLSDIKNILFLGKFNKYKNLYYDKLIQKDISISKQFSNENTHIVLGNGQYRSKIDTNWKGIFTTEEILAKTLNITQEKLSYKLSNSTTANIKNLLSSNENNIELALQLLEGKNVPKELISILYFIMVSNNNSSNRIKARNLIKDRVNPEALKYTKKDFTKEYRIDLILNELEKCETINCEEIADYLFKLNNKSWLFIYENYDSFIFNKFRGINLDLSFAELKEIPGEIKNIKSFKSINLSNNKLKEITINDVEKLKQFSEIDLSHNPLELICPELLQLPDLRILKLRACNIDYANKTAWITIFK